MSFRYSWRFEKNAALKTAVRIIGQAEATNVLFDLQAPLTWVSIRTPAVEATPDHRYCDFAQKSNHEIRALLRELSISPETELRIIWLGDTEGVLLKNKLWIEHFDDIYYPSSDDLVITDARRTFIIYIDHEEWLRYANLVDG